MTKRIESTRRIGMILLIMVMVAGNLLACALPWQGSGSTTPQPIPIDDEDIIVADDGEPVVNGNGDKTTFSPVASAMCRKGMESACSILSATLCMVLVASTTKSAPAP